MGLIPTSLSWRKWNKVREIFHLQYKFHTPKFSISMANVYGLVWCKFVNIIPPPTRFGQYQNYRNVQQLSGNQIKYAYWNLVVSTPCLLDVLDIIIHRRNMHAICPHPLQIILPYVLFKIIGNQNSGLIIARGVYVNKMGMSLSVVTHAAATEHSYTDSFSYFL